MARGAPAVRLAGRGEHAMAGLLRTRDYLNDWAVRTPLVGCPPVWTLDYLRRLRNTSSAPDSREMAVKPVPGSISGAVGAASAYIEAPTPKRTIVNSFLTSTTSLFPVRKLPRFGEVC